MVLQQLMNFQKTNVQKLYEPAVVCWGNNFTFSIFIILKKFHSRKEPYFKVVGTKITRNHWHLDNLLKWEMMTL